MKKFWRVEVKVTHGKDIVFHRAVEYSTLPDIKRWLKEQVANVEKL